MIRRGQLWQWLGAGGGLVVASCLLSLSVVAASVSRGYQTDQNLVPGTLVSLQAEQSETVEAATLETIDRMFGVVVDTDSSLLIVGENSASGYVQVATDGTLDVLVTDLAGPIAADDHLSLSPLSGIAQKATTETITIGNALSGYNGEPELTVGTVEVTQDGKAVTAQLGKVQVQFEIGANPEFDQLEGALPGFLQAIGNSVAGETVSPFRIITASLVLLITFLISGAILFGAIRSSLTAIGRNPLSKRGIYSGLAQVFGLVGLVLGAGVGTIYLILKL